MASALAVQMFTLRDFTKTERDFTAALARCRAIGYEAVQLSAVGCMGGERPEVSASRARQLLDEHGLRCVATHRGWEALLGPTAAEIEFHRALGCGYVAVGGLPGSYHEAGADGYRRFIREAQTVLPKLRAAGLTFGYHNHAHEFVRIAPGPRTCYDLLIDEGGNLLTLELDTFWAMHAGADPVALLRRLHGRVPVVHFKDKEVVAEGPVMAPIGEGNLNWDAIIAACRAAGTQWYCVEQDTCRRDPFDCLRASFEFLSAKGL